MNREIKFRAKVNGGYVYSDSYVNLAFYFDATKGYEQEQYTGLKDKNGKEIFDGDIVSGYTTIDNKPVQAKSGKLVTFRNGCFCWGNEPLGWDFDAEEHPCEWPTENWAVVIGNIFENPELLK